jgi:regulator of replication initiation timing
MIPAYKEEVKITIKESDPNSPLEQQVRQLQDQVRQLIETVEYMNRERGRLKSEVEELKHRFNKG